uniref:F-box domain-containing protein n=1 Tax=Lotharella oceanica TaxID=641309 RepID=A0A7S2TMF4_9EUKA|mmetsp:Transcript_21002/g.39411  ORF Transcript_21002/g.39411 Transcript_21002/m.39411 type:complete len:278 (+) Transcript_21002:91-924(+)
MELDHQQAFHQLPFEVAGWIFWTLMPSELATLATTCRGLHSLITKVAENWIVRMESMRPVLRLTNPIMTLYHERIIILRDTGVKDFLGFSRGKEMFRIGDCVTLHKPQSDSKGSRYPTMAMITRMYRPNKPRNGTRLEDGLERGWAVIEARPFCTWDQTFLAKLVPDAGVGGQSAGSQPVFPQSRQLFLMKSSWTLPVERIHKHLNVRFVVPRPMDVEDFHRMRKDVQRNNTLAWYCRHTYDRQDCSFGTLPPEALAQVDANNATKRDYYQRSRIAN